MIDFPTHIEAEIFFIPTEEGGRTTPVYDGYRGQFYYLGWDCDASYTFKNKEYVKPGEVVQSLISFASPEWQTGKIYSGMKFDIREGARVVAKGKVTKLMDLVKS